MINATIISDNAFRSGFYKDILSKNSFLRIKQKIGSLDQIEFNPPDLLIVDAVDKDWIFVSHLKELISRLELPAIAVSNKNSIFFDLMDSGVLDIVCKFSGGPKQTEQFEKTLFQSVAETAEKLKKNTDTKSMLRIYQSIHNANFHKVIAIGSSTGGTEAVFSIINKLPVFMPSILIVQHMPQVFTYMYAQRLNDSCQMLVKEAKDGDRIRPGVAYVAPGDFHMRISNKGNLHIVCEKGSKVSGHCPSVDVLFHSVAELRSRAMGVILTGMGSDGADGLLHMHENGSFTIGQDEKTSVVYGMPKAAYQKGAVDVQTGLDEIAGYLRSFGKNPVLI